MGSLARLELMDRLLACPWNERGQLFERQPRLLPELGATFVPIYASAAWQLHRRNRQPIECDCRAAQDPIAFVWREAGKD